MRKVRGSIPLRSIFFLLFQNSKKLNLSESVSESARLNFYRYFKPKIEMNFFEFEKILGPEGDRSPDLPHAKRTLYH
jgi:hypothetical protein